MSKRTDQQAKAKGAKATKRKRKKAAEIRQYGRFGAPLKRTSPESRPSQEPERFAQIASMMGMAPLAAGKQ